MTDPNNTSSDEETLNNEPASNPWDNAPKDCYFYDVIYPDGHLGAFTESAELAYKLGRDIEHNYIPISDTQQSDINGWTYRKDVCPMKTQEMIDRENAIQEIAQLKKQLSDTDYKAIKYAEGQLTESEYSATRSQRASWRARINELEALL